MRHLCCFLTLLLVTVSVAGAQHAHDLAERRIIEFPDVPGYHTLTCDSPHPHGVLRRERLA